MNKDLIAANRLALAGELTPGLRHDVNNRCAVVMNNMAFAPSVLDGFQDQLGTLESMLRSGRDIGELGLFVQGLRAKADEDVEELNQVFRECLDAARSIVAYNKQISEVARASRQHSETMDVLVQAAVDTAGLWQRKSVMVRVTELPPWRVADPDRFFQLMLNLILNARQAFVSADYDNRITVRIQGRRLVVENNGDPEADSRLAQPGLGLWSAQQLARDLDLELEVDLRADGATVSVVFAAGTE